MKVNTLRKSPVHPNKGLQAKSRRNESGAGHETSQVQGFPPFKLAITIAHYQTQANVFHSCATREPDLCLRKIHLWNKPNPEQTCNLLFAFFVLTLQYIENEETRARHPFTSNYTLASEGQLIYILLVWFLESQELGFDTKWSNLENDVGLHNYSGKKESHTYSLRVPIPVKC